MLRSTIIRVDHMCCGMEAKMIRDLLDPMETVAEVKISLTDKRVNVQHRDVLTPDELINLLNAKQPAMRSLGGCPRRPHDAPANCLLPAAGPTDHRTRALLACSKAERHARSRGPAARRADASVGQHIPMRRCRPSGIAMAAARPAVLASARHGWPCFQQHPDSLKVPP